VAGSTTRTVQRALVERGWRYTSIGLVCALCNYAIILAVDAVGGHYLLATLIAFLAVTPIGFVLHSRFTFAEPLRWTSFVRFVAGVASAYPLAVLSMVVLCSGFKLSVAIAVPIATGVVFLWNFAAAHWAILPRFNLRDFFSKREPASIVDDDGPGTEV
jgi:putative flippase GtrA